MLRMKGAVKPATSTVKAPVADVVAGEDDLPLTSIATTVPAMGAPVAAVPVSLGSVATGVVTDGVSDVGVVVATEPVPEPPPQPVIAMASAVRAGAAQCFNRKVIALPR
jgi:hypothetical protein